MSSKVEQLRAQLNERILVLDGGMGTMIQSYRLNEADFRGERFADWPCDLKGNNDLLVLSKPEVIAAIHNAYFEAGADIIETNTFNSTTIAMADYQMESLSAEINFAAAKLARACADEWTARTPEKPRYVAGVLGPHGVQACLDAPQLAGVASVVRGEVEQRLRRLVRLLGAQAAHEAAGDRALVGRQVAAGDARERGLAAPVVAEQSGPPLGEGDGHVVQDGFDGGRVGVAHLGKR